MAVKMRIIQVFDPGHEAEFMALEQKFAQLEADHPAFPRGTRYQPISSTLPTHTLIWEGIFDSVDAGRAALAFFDGNDDHEALAVEQRPFFRDIKVEFLELLFAD
jgi:hypothetical protein